MPNRAVGCGHPAAENHCILHHVSCRPRLPFFPRRKKGRKERRQNQGFGILSAGGVRVVSKSFSLANWNVQVQSLLSYSPCVSLRDARPACAALAGQGKSLRLPCGAMWTSRHTHKKGPCRMAGPFHKADIRFYQKSALPTVRGCSSTSRMLLTPVRYMTIRSKPRPKPACLQLP